LLIWKKRYGGGAKEKYLVTLHEYVLFYAKNIDSIDPIFIPLDENSINDITNKKIRTIEKEDLTEHIH
jgi:adenine-specific DNA-methyltransferase